MDAKEIQIHACQKNQRMDSALFKATRPKRKQFAHLCRSLTCWNGLKANSLPPVGRLLDVVGFLFFILPRVSNASPVQTLKFSIRVLKNGRLCTLLVDSFQCVA